MLEDAQKSFTESIYKYLITYNTYMQSKITKNNLNHKNGDFSISPCNGDCVPPLLRLHLPADIGFEESSSHNDVKHTAIATDGTPNWPLDIVSVTKHGKTMTISLNRPLTTEVAIRQCIRNNEFMKQAFSRDRQLVIDDISQKEECSLTALRVVLLKNVINNLAKLRLRDEYEAPNVVVTARSSLPAPPSVCVAVCGPVLNMKTGAKETTLTATDYIAKRQKEMMLVAQHKYGLRACTDARWTQFEQQLGEAAVTFELLQAKLSSAVKVDFDNSTTGSSRGVGFVLYNGARMETLVDTFRQKVEARYYPPLPDLGDIDFSLLTDEDEWRLLFNYVLGFPSVLEDSFRVNDSGVELAPHNLAAFLSALAHRFSKYYQRVKILTEGRAHLIPVLCARVALITALSDTFKAALRVLNISPIAHM